MSLATKQVVKQGRRRASLALSCVSLAVLTACGGGSSSGTDETPGEVAQTLSGTVAVGAPMSDVRIRILDAAGNVVAQGSDITVNADTGAFSGVELTGSGPYRIEACGQSGQNYLCVYSATQGPGVANVTPLTTAAVLLAAGLNPEALMTGANSLLDAASLEDAQDTLRTSLASVLTDADLASNFDFIGGALTGGSRAGYDRVLDSIGVSTGEDDHPFVQLTPRLGTGNIYLQPDLPPVGSLTVDSNADDVSLQGIEPLFRQMSQALVSPEACANQTTGLVSLLATHAQMSFGEGDPAIGKANVASLMCDFIGSGDEGPGWGVTFLSPTLGRCDLSGDPVCRVSFVLKLSDGSVESIGEEMAVVREAGVWKFKGDVNPLSFRANATVQRTQVFGPTSGDAIETTYARALQIEVQAYTGLACAKVTQKDESSVDTVVAYFKRFDIESRRLSAWREPYGPVELDPQASTGELRGGDDTWLQLPEGSEGDDVVRNFYKGGRTLTVHLYSDVACSVPMTVAGKSHFNTDVMGIPPTQAKFATLPWPKLTTASLDALRSLELGSNQSRNAFQIGWTFDRGYTGFSEASVCSDQATCGGGDVGRIGDARASSAAQAVTMTLSNQGEPVTASSFKMIALYGRSGDGMTVQSNYVYCSNGVASHGQCHSEGQSSEQSPAP